MGLPRSVAAFRWLNEHFRRTHHQLQRELGPAADEAELYCQVLEHKWFLSEWAKRDAGLELAIKEYVALRSEQPTLALLCSASAPLPTILEEGLSPPVLATAIQADSPSPTERIDVLS